MLFIDSNFSGAVGPQEESQDTMRNRMHGIEKDYYAIQYK
eukprot:SAG31_NODE_1014_length_10366_cov_2.357129_1_plen_40_part_00